MPLVADENMRAGFGVKLRQFREALGLTQRELGEKTGLLQQAIARIEAGMAPSWANAVRIAEALGKPLDDFITE